MDNQLKLKFLIQLLEVLIQPEDSASRELVRAKIKEIVMSL